MKLIEKTTVVRRPGELPLVDTKLVWDFTEEVTRGATWLDNTFGSDWWKDLELEALDLKSGVQCVLGQLAMTRFREQLIEFNFGESGPCDCGDPECTEPRERAEGRRFDYSDVTVMLRDTEDYGWSADTTGLPSQYGFFINSVEGDELLSAVEPALGINDREHMIQQDAWEHLTWAWMDEIRARRLIEQKMLDEKADRELRALLNEESKEMQSA